MPILSPCSAKPASTAAWAQVSISAERVERLLVEAGVYAPQQPAAAHHLEPRRERQHGGLGPVGRDQTPVVPVLVGETMHLSPSW